MLRVTCALALLALPSIAIAQTQTQTTPQTQKTPSSQVAAPRTDPAADDQQAQSGQPPKRIRNITLTGSQPCPKSTADEIVVCQTIPEPYRIPKSLRDAKPIPAQNQSWVNRAATADQVGRVAGGLPDTCSPVGTGGQSGCALQANRAYAAEKRQQAREASSIP